MDVEKEKIHQHYVPACYLANFGVKGNNGRKSKIFFYDISAPKSGNETRISSVNKFPTEKNFYDIPELEDNKKLLENFFGKIEGEYSKLLEKILQYVEQKKANSKLVTFTQSDRESIVGQFAMQIVRTKYYRDRFDSIYQTLHTAFPWGCLPKYNQEDFRRLHTLDLLNFKMANFYANLLNDRNWVFLVNHTKVPFFTSDNPAIFINNGKGVSAPLSPVAEQMTFFIPLSPMVAVELYHKNVVKKPEVFVHVYDEKSIKWYNINLARRCFRFIMSNQSDFSTLEVKDEQG